MSRTTTAEVAEAKATEQVQEAEIIEIGAYVKESDRAEEDRLASEIVTLTAQTKQMVLFNSIEIGRRLAEAKKIVKHGQWGNWLKERVNYSQRSANNFMKIYHEYGKSGLAEKSQSIANLSYTQALTLLELPEPERQKFAEEKEAAELTIKELRSEIAKLNKEKSETADSIQLLIDEKERERKAADERVAGLREQMAKMEADAEKAKESRQNEIEERIRAVVKAGQRELEKAKKDLAEIAKEKEQLVSKQEEAIEAARKEEKKRASEEMRRQSQIALEKLEQSEERFKKESEKVEATQALYKKEKGKNDLAGDLATTEYLLERVLDECSEALDLLDKVRKKDENKGIELIEDFRAALESLWKKADSKWS